MTTNAGPRRTVTTDEVMRRCADEPTLPVPFSATAMGKGVQTAYVEIRNGTFDLPVIRSGRRLRIPSAALLTYLGLPVPTAPTPAPPTPPPPRRSGRATSGGG
jgi:hypothetical protein